MRIVVVAVGRLRPPFADDVQHYQKLLARHARLELVEVREDEQVEYFTLHKGQVCYSHLVYGHS